MAYYEGGGGGPCIDEVFAQNSRPSTDLTSFKRTWKSRMHHNEDEDDAEWMTMAEWLHFLTFVMLYLMDLRHDCLFRELRILSCNNNNNLQKCFHKNTSCSVPNSARTLIIFAFSPLNFIPYEYYSELNKSPTSFCTEFIIKFTTTIIPFRSWIFATWTAWHDMLYYWST